MKIALYASVAALALAFEHVDLERLERPPLGECPNQVRTGEAPADDDDSQFRHLVGLGGRDPCLRIGR